MLQDVQRNAAGRKGLQMNIRVGANDICAQITEVRPLNPGLEEYEHEYFAPYYTEMEMDAKFIKISAFFASHITSYSVSLYNAN